MRLINKPVFEAAGMCLYLFTIDRVHVDRKKGGPRICSWLRTVNLWTVIQKKNKYNKFLLRLSLCSFRSVTAVHPYTNSRGKVAGLLLGEPLPGRSSSLYKYLLTYA